MSNKEYFITHLVPTELPVENSLRKILFYTTTREGMSEKKYFWGTGNNSFSETDIRDKVNTGELIELPEAKKLEEKKGLWLDSKGCVYYADLVSPNKDKQKHPLLYLK